MGLIPGWGRSSGKGSDSLLQYSCLENSMDRGAWWATVHGVTESQIRLTVHAPYVLTYVLPWYEGKLV